jgi:hypothetical protein
MLKSTLITALYSEVAAMQSWFASLHFVPVFYFMNFKPASNPHEISNLLFSSAKFLQIKWDFLSVK